MGVLKLSVNKRMQRAIINTLMIMILSMLTINLYPVISFADDAESGSEAIWVTESQYNSSYNNSDYELLDKANFYQYATRTKSTTTSGYDTLSGWTKYDTKTSSSTSGYLFGTPISTSTSYANNKKTVTSAVDKGYYYYAYAVANPFDTSDWTYYVAKTRAAVISHMKENFSSSATWAESRLRYFWYISPTDLGTVSSKFNKKTPYCADSTVSVGTTSQSGTHLYDLKFYKYKQCYKKKTDITTNYFYKWSDWSSWSQETQDRESVPSDGSKKENIIVKYLVKPVKKTTPLSECDFTLNGESEFNYDGTEKFIEFQLTYDGNALEEGIDYVVNGNSGTDAGEYTVSISGLGDYSGQITQNFKIRKIKPALDFESNSITKSKDADDFVNALFAKTDGEVVFSSGNEDVATVGADGTVSVVGRGITTISVQSSEGANYLSGEASYELIIASNLYDCLIECTDGSSFTYDKTEKKLKFTITDGDYKLIEGQDYELIDNSGTNAGRYSVKIKGIGEYVGQVNQVLTINKAAPKLEFVSTTVTKQVDDSKFVNELSAETDGEISYTVSDDDVASVDENGEITLKKPGTITVQAKSSEGGNYKAGSATYALTVVEAQKALELNEVSYSFKNYWDDFGYARNYIIPASTYRMMFGRVVGNAFYEANKNKSWGGNCAGISGTAALLIDKNNDIHVKSFNEVAENNKDLKVKDQTADQLVLLEFIEALQISQNSSLFNVTDAKYRVSNKELDEGSKNLNILVSTVTEQTDAGIPVMMTIRCAGIGGHALLAYKVDIDENTGKIFVYDSNHPLQECTIEIKRKSNGAWDTWSYDMGSKGEWGSDSDAGECCFGMVPYGVIKSIWEQRGELQKSYNILSTKSKNIEIYDVEDNLLARIDDKDLDYSANGVVRHIGELGISENSDDGIILSLPVDVYKIKNVDESQDSFDLEMLNSDLASQIETSADEVTLVAADEYGLNQVFIDAASNDYYSVTLNSSAQNDSEEVVVKGNGSGDTLQISQIDGKISVENCQITSMSVDDAQMAKKTIKAKAYGHGTISPAGNENVVVGSDKVYEITPDEGYDIQDVLVDDVSIGAVDTYVFKNASTDHEIVAVFDTISEIKKIDNTIYASDITVKASSKNQTIKLNASNDGNTNMIYRSSSNDVTIDSNGVVTVKKNFTGSATITIIAASDNIFNQAEKRITLTVRASLKGVAGLKVKAQKGKKIKVTWKKQANVTGYEIQYSTSKNFKNAKAKKVKGAKKKVLTIKKLKAKKNYYVRVRSYKIDKNGLIQSDWSKAKKVKTKK